MNGCKLGFILEVFSKITAHNMVIRLLKKQNASRKS